MKTENETDFKTSQIEPPHDNNILQPVFFFFFCCNQCFSVTDLQQQKNKLKAQNHVSRAQLKQTLTAIMVTSNFIIENIYIYIIF